MVKQRFFSPGQQLLLAWPSLSGSPASLSRFTLELSRPPAKTDSATNSTYRFVNEQAVFALERAVFLIVLLGHAGTSERPGKTDASGL